MYEKELHEEITKIWDDPDFANGALCYLDTDEQRKKVLDGIRSGKIDTAQEVFGYVMELAGFCERVE
jgi:hypothetical protein